MNTEERRVLEWFLKMPVSTTDDVFAAFRELPGAVEKHEEGNRGYLYVPGQRADRCVLAAHADTYFDMNYMEPRKGVSALLSKVRSYFLGAASENKIVFENGEYRSGSDDCGIGADDRAGCAMLWLLRNSGHSLLILNGEEHGQKGAHYLQESSPELFDEINDHSFIIQLDRRGSRDYKFYHLPVTSEFEKYVVEGTGYECAGTTSRTDICVLCEKICGVNLSVGYYNEHHPEEFLRYDEWLGTYQIVKRMVEEPLKQYLLEKGI